MKKSIFYNNIFLYSSLQFIGNIEEYFSKHTKKLVVFIVMPRQQPKASLLRLYNEGKLIEERNITLSRNIIVYYLLWYFHYLYFLWRYFSKDEKIFVITFHPISFFAMTIQKMVRHIEYVFWIGDYFPPVNWSLIMFERLKSYYHSSVTYACYLSDTINKIMNKKVMNTYEKKTVMWGVLPKNIERKPTRERFDILFVGVIKESQGLEFLFEFLKKNKEYSAHIIGICTGDLYQKYRKMIQENSIESQVDFPNRFYSDEELEDLSRLCNVGIAFYDVDETSATYYTDPGKVKTYASLGLPIIMSNVSSVAPFIKRFKNGKVIEKTQKELEAALKDIKKNYSTYLDGVKRFNDFFFYDTYYRSSFKFLEEYEK